VCFFISHARLRVHRAPGFPCALCFSRGGTTCRTRAQTRRGNVDVCLCRPCERRDLRVSAIALIALPRRVLSEVLFDGFRAATDTCGYGSLRSQGRHKNEWLFENRIAALSAARLPTRREFAPRSECLCESSSGRISRSANGCCRRRAQIPPAPYRGQGCA